MGCGVIASCFPPIFPANSYKIKIFKIKIKIKFIFRRKASPSIDKSGG